MSKDFEINVSSGVPDAKEELLANDPEHAPGAMVSRVARLGAWNVLGYLLSAVATVGINVVAARTLGPSGFGTYSYLIWVVRIVVWLGLFGIPTALNRSVSEMQGANDPEGSRGIFRAGLRYLSFAMPLVFTATAVWVWAKSGDLWLAGGLGVSAVLLSYYMAFEYSLGGLRRYQKVAGNAAVVAAAHLGALAVVVFLTPARTGHFLGMYVAMAVISFGVWGRSLSSNMRRWRTRPVSVVERKKFLRLSGQMALLGLSDSILWGRPELFFLDRFWSSTEVGIYSAAMALQTLAISLPLIASRVLTPEFAWMRGGGLDDALRRSFPVVCTYIALVAVPLGIGGAVLASDLLSVVYGGAYLDATVGTIVLMAGSTIIILAGPATSAAITGPEPGFIAKVSGAMAVLNLSFDVLLIPRFGIEGAALATTLSQVLSVLIAVVYVRRKMALVYPMGKIAAIAGAAFVASAGAHRAVRFLDLPARVAATIVLAIPLYCFLVIVLKVLRWQDVLTLLRNLRTRTQS